MRSGARWLVAVVTLVTVWLTLAVTIAPHAAAHGFEPVVLEIVEEQPRSYRVTWVPAPIDGVTPVFPPGCRASALPLPSSAASHLACDRDLAGALLTLPGLAQTHRTALVRFTPRDGAPSLVVAEGTGDVVTLPTAPPPLPVARYLQLGLEHVLAGWDHLLFVLALAAWVRAPRAILLVLTAFTVAHSLTLAIAVLRLVHVPPAPVEVCIAASVVLLAAAILRRPLEPAPPRVAARVAFGAGLLHGLGFAGALQGVGLPRGHVAAALVAFNVGVEAGQVVFVLVLLALVALARRVTTSRLPERVVVYAAGCAAACAFFERVRVLVVG